MGLCRLGRLCRGQRAEDPAALIDADAPTRELNMKEEEDGEEDKEEGAEEGGGEEEEDGGGHHQFKKVGDRHKEVAMSLASA